LTAPFTGPHGSAVGAQAGCPCKHCGTARQYLADHADDLVIPCPWCGDWEDLNEVEDQLVTGRFFGCAMCVSWRYSASEYVACSLCAQVVPVSRTVHLHGGRGREPKVNCIPCMLRSALAWSLTDCPFCVLVAKRVLDALREYEQAGRVVTLPAVPTEDLPQHRPGCPWEHDVLL